MTAEGHFLFSIACAVFAKNAEITPVLAQGDWWHIIPSSVLTCLLPDIDHPSSFLGQRLRWISKPIARMFGHRGFTHGLLSLFSAMALLHLRGLENLTISADLLQGMILGYVSHIVADMLTPSGVPLLWPCRWRFCLPILISQKGKQLERIFCLIFLSLAVWMPYTFSKCNTIYWSSKIVDFFQNLFEYVI